MKRLLTASFLCMFAVIHAADLDKNATFVRLSSMTASPKIDGVIEYGEWDLASTSFGGISNKTGLLTRRENNFRFGYDSGKMYFAMTSVMPIPPQYMTGDDKVEFIIVAPGGKKTTIVIDSEGKGEIPDGVVFANRLEPSIFNRYRNKCWTIEASVPLEVLGAKAFEDGSEWRLQMIRHWSNDKESGYWHHPEKCGGMGVFMPDSKAPVISFDGFGNNGYEASGNYQWTYRLENPTNAEIDLYSDSYMHGVSGEATLDINNPNFVGNAKVYRIFNESMKGFSTVVKPGKKEYFLRYEMALFPGSKRFLFSKIYNRKDNTLYYQRAFLWDLRAALLAARYQDKTGLPYLNAAFYPSFGNKLRVAATFNKKYPIYAAEIQTKDSAGKVLWETRRDGGGKPLEDFEDETVLKGLPLGDYTVTLTSTDAKGKKIKHIKTFSMRKFPWHDQNIGRERVIIPPFKPLKLDRKKQRISALLTGYRQGGGLWDEIIAEGENILTAPVHFFLDGKPVIPGKAKLISQEDDRIVYESKAEVGNVTFTFNLDYDYDGFCKVTVRAVPDGKVPVSDFGFHVPLKNSVVKYYNGLNKSGRRDGDAPDLTLASGEGELGMPGVICRNGMLPNYVWLGGVYKGFCWIIDSSKDCSFSFDKMNWNLRRDGDTVSFRQYFVNKPTEWSTPKEWIVGFEPTPVKPRNEKYLAMTGWMYDYEVPTGADHGDMRSDPLSDIGRLDYPLNSIQEIDSSFYDLLFASRNGETPPEEKRIAIAREYVERNKERLAKEMPLIDPKRLFRGMLDKRMWGKRYFLHYQLPTLYSHRWPEAEMYKAEWMPWDYPVDDAADEYLANQTSSHTDFLLYKMRKEVRRGYDGMNFDTFALGGGFNTVVGAGARYKKGKVPFMTNEIMYRIVPEGIHGGKLLFGWRELMKRTATMLYVEGKLPYGTPWVDLHATNGLVCPVLAFCSTTITWERGGGGNEYQRRFPLGHVIVDTIGTQAGITPQLIVKTQSSKQSPAEQVKSLIGASYAYGTLVHVDQGVHSGYDNYRKSRDIPYAFGYGRPENKTLFFYSKEPQPIKCDNSNILTTQVIRPDGKALIMVGNMSDKEEKARFDLSGLKYSGYRIKDMFSGLMMASAEIVIEKYGYALLQIEDGPSLSVEDIEKHNKRITGEVFEYNKPELMMRDSRTEDPEFVDGAFVLGGSVHFWSKEFVELEPDRTYTWTADMRKKNGKDLPGITMAAIFFDKDRKRLPTNQYVTVPETGGTLAREAAAGSVSVFVKPAFAENKYPEKGAFVVAFNARDDESDLPNVDLSPAIKEIRRSGGLLEIVLSAPLGKTVAAGTSVRLHRNYSFYRTVPEGCWYNRLADQWKTFGGRITIPNGARYMKPAIISYDGKREGFGTYEVKNLKLLVK